MADYRYYEYSPPLLGVFFAAFLDEEPRCNAINVNNSGYLGYQKFPEGIRPDEIVSWKDELQYYRNKNYLPLICFPTSENNDSIKTRNDVISHVGSVVARITQMLKNYETAIHYSLYEITENVVEHAKTKRGWVSFQYFPRKDYLDLCIADTGIGLLQSYKDYKGGKDYSHI